MTTWIEYFLYFITFDHSHHNWSTVHGKVLLRQWLTRYIGGLALWYHVYGSSWTAKIIQKNNLIITREAGWCYGIMSTVPHEQQKIMQTNNLIITREHQPASPCWSPTNLEPSISYDVYVLTLMQIIAQDITTFLFQY